MGVRTPMLDRVDPLCSPMLEQSAIEPELVARVAVEALADDRFLILPHPEVAEWYAARSSTSDEWLANMRGHDRLVRIFKALEPFDRESFSASRAAAWTRRSAAWSSCARCSLALVQVWNAHYSGE